MEQYWAQAHVMRFLLGKVQLMRHCSALSDVLAELDEQVEVAFDQPSERSELMALPEHYRLQLNYIEGSWQVLLRVGEVIAMNFAIMRWPAASFELFSVSVDPQWQRRDIMKQCVTYILSVLSRVFGELPINAHLMHPATARYFAPSTTCCHEQWYDVAVSLSTKSLVAYHQSHVGGQHAIA